MPKQQERAEELLPKISQNRRLVWIDAFLAYRDDFEFAPPPARPWKRSTPSAPARRPRQETLDEARAAFQQGRPDEGYGKYQEIVDKYYAAASYRNVKRWLAERK